MIVEPYFESEWDRFSGHNCTPTSHLESEWAAIVQNGNTITAAVPRLQVMGTMGLSSTVNPCVAALSA